MAARLVDNLPEDWLYALKFDGYRALVIKNGAKVRFLWRKVKELTSMFPSIVRASEQLKPSQVVLDGEIVALDEQGKPAFQALEPAGMLTSLSSTQLICCTSMART